MARGHSSLQSESAEVSEGENVRASSRLHFPTKKYKPLFSYWKPAFPLETFTVNSENLSL